jgi:hypothetical protein
MLMPLCTGIFIICNIFSLCETGPALPVFFCDVPRPRLLFLRVSACQVVGACTRTLFHGQLCAGAWPPHKNPKKGSIAWG